jgi:hypothetical protein
MKGKWQSWLIKRYTMKIYAGVDVQTHVFLTLVLVGGELSASCSSRFTTRENAPWYYLTVGSECAALYSAALAPGAESPYPLSRRLDEH